MDAIDRQKVLEVVEALHFADINKLTPEFVTTDMEYGWSLALSEVEKILRSLPTPQTQEGEDG